MYIQRFQCTSQEPLILFKKAKTEQSTETLEYIPGALFKGFVANKLFDKSKNKPTINDEIINNIVFNGTVYFGDAHLVINEQRSLPIPLSYHKFQSKEHGDIINLAKCDLPTTKIKQIKDGYFMVEGSEIVSGKVEISERMKAARSLAHRASEESGMYMYRYIASGQTFQFDVRTTTTDQMKEVTDILTKEKENVYLGKSKSAEFGGKLKIEAIVTPAIKPFGSKVKTLFAASNWCFLNEYGSYTAHLTSDMLCGHNQAQIDWSKSFLRFRTYAPFNFHRKAFDAQRLIIEKGSVIVFKEEVDVDINFFTNGIGLHKSEGFGEVEVNPDFLDFEKFSLIENIKPVKPIVNETEDPIYLLLKERNDLKFQLKIDYYKAETLNDECKFSNAITPSQWSNILMKVKYLTDIKAIEQVLITNDGTRVNKSNHSKWQEKDFNILKKLITKSGNTQVFKIFVKSKINPKKNA
jgi:hypothetical protein